MEENIIGNLTINQILVTNAENFKELFYQENVEAEESLKRNKVIQIVIKIVKLILIMGILASTMIIVFFKTDIFKKYKELWVQTAMSTMSHQYLATLFLAEEEINEIMDSLEVVNTENSNVEEISTNESEIDESHIAILENENNVSVEKIAGKGYVGYVMTIKDPSKVKLVDSRKNNAGTKLSEIVETNNAIAGINAGGFIDENGHGNGGQLSNVAIIDGKLINGNNNSKYAFIGFNNEGTLILGRYTYEEARAIGMVSAVEFGPYIIVNGKKQITNSNSGGIQPRTAIGQKKDGTLIFVCIDGRKPGYSLGTTLMELQNIFERYEVYNAANLDGGSSTTMYFEGKLVNKPSTPSGERYLPNAIIVEK